VQDTLKIPLEPTTLVVGVIKQILLHFCPFVIAFQRWPAVIALPLQVPLVFKFALVALILPLLSYVTPVINAVAFPLVLGPSYFKVPAVSFPSVVVYTAKSAVEPILPSLVISPCP